MALPEKELERQLREAGNKLLSLPSPLSELLVSLSRVESLLTRVEQSPSESMKKALSPSTKALITNELLRHSDIDVRVAVASCISEITRITAPDAPYEDDQMKDVFQLIVSTFEKMDERICPSYSKRITILETVAKVRSCVVMLDLECDALITEMFQHFFKYIRPEHPENVFSSMETIMTLVIEESEDISIDLLSLILDVLKSESKEVLSVARLLAENVTQKCAKKLKPFLLPALKSLGTTVDDYSQVIANALQEEDEDEAIKPSDADADGDAASKNADESNVANAPPEKAVEVALETLDDAPPSEEVGPVVAGSPKTVVSNGIVQKETEDTCAGNDTSKEVKHEAHDEEAEPSKTNVENSDTEKLIKLRIKPDKANKRKGKKASSVKSSAEPSKPTLTDEKVKVEALKPEEKDGKDVDNAQSEAPVVESAEPAENEKESEAPVSSPPKASDEPVDLPTPSPSGGSLADGTQLNKANQEEKKDELVESVPADVDMKKESDMKKSSEGAISEYKSHKRTGKKVSPLAGKEDSVPSLADVPKVDEKTSELDVKLAKQSGKKVEDEKTSELDAKPAKQSGKKVEDEKTSELDAKPAKQSGKKVEDEKTSELDAKSAKQSGKKVEDEKTSELDAKSAKQSGKKVELVGSQRKDKKKHRQGKGTPTKEITKTPAKDEGKKSAGLAKSTAKSAKDESPVGKASKSSSKRKHSSGHKTSKYGKELVGSKVKVWWPDDKKFYRGTIELFDPSSGKHKVLYDDGDVENLKLETEEWKLIDEGSALDQAHLSDSEGPDESTEMPSAKKAKISPVQGVKQAKTETSTKKAGSSSSKSKTTKSRTKQKDDSKTDCKEKDETLKSMGKSEGKGGKTKESKSGNKTSDNASKSAGKLKDTNEAVTPKGTSKSKQETPKSASNSKRKPPKSGSKSKTDSINKAKATPTAMEEETEDVLESSSPELVKAPETAKGKSQSGSKSKKSAKKRKRGTKG